MIGLLNTTKFICVGGESWWDQGCDDCLEGTRGAILDEIDLWTRDFTKPPIYWLDGLAGTGKSAIAETVAKRMHADGRLGASFFYSRKSNPGHTSPALAFQLAMRHTEFRLIYVPLVRLNPDVITAPPHEQMKRLVFEPLMKSLISTVIVIDALDQCEDEETVSAILSALGEFLSRTPKVKFLITSRPKPHIRKGLLPLIKSRIVTTFALHEVELHQVKSDIRRLFTEKLPELQRLWLLADGESPGPDRWPTEEHLDRLSQRAAGFFTHAVAIVNFLHNEHASPIERLNLLLESPERALLNTEICNETTLGSFYTSTLQRAFDDSKPEDDRKVRSVLGAVVLAKNALSPSTIAKLLGMDPEHVLLCLESVQSLLILQGGNDGLVRPFHESFPAFLTDQEVCTDERFYVSSPAHHMVLLIGCLELVNKGLKEIVLKRSDAAKYSRVRGGQQIDSALEYACTSWHKHLAGTIPGDNVPEIAQRLRLFLTETFPFWWREFGARGAAQLAKAAVKELNVWSEVRSNFPLNTRAVLTEISATPWIPLGSLKNV